MGSENGQMKISLPVPLSLAQLIPPEQASKSQKQQPESRVNGYCLRGQKGREGQGSDDQKG